MTATKTKMTKRLAYDALDLDEIRLHAWLGLRETNLDELRERLARIQKIAERALDGHAKDAGLPSGRRTP